MTIIYEKLLNYKIPEVRQKRSKLDTIIYALGIGFGTDPADEDELKFVYEAQLKALPSMAVVMCTAHGWLRNPETGTSGRSVAAEHSFNIYKPLPVEGAFIGKTSVTRIIDKGPGKAALVTSKRDIYNEATAELLCSHTQTSYCRGDGGFGGPNDADPPHSIPQRPADLQCSLQVPYQAGLIYRLSGDKNPLHVDPVAARKAGFERPILHGLCTMGIAAHAIIKTCCGYDADKVAGMGVRFSSPVFPGDLLRTDIWISGAQLSFRTVVPEHEDKIVLDNGWCNLF